MRSDPTFWLLARSSGSPPTSAYSLGPRRARPQVASVRARGQGGVVSTESTASSPCSGSALAVHGITLVLDRTLRMPLAGAPRPGRSPYRPRRGRAGVLAGGADRRSSIVSFPLRRRIGTEAWRRLHWTTYAIFAAATAHGLLAGSDSRTAVGARPLPRRRRRSRLRDRVAALTGRPATSNRKEHREVPDRHRPARSHGFGDCADLAPTSSRSTARQGRSLRVGTSPRSDRTRSRRDVPDGRDQRPRARRRLTVVPEPEERERARAGMCADDRAERDDELQLGVRAPLAHQHLELGAPAPARRRAQRRAGTPARPSSPSRSPRRARRTPSALPGRA